MVNSVRLSNNHKAKQGFTLIELMVVVIVVGVLAAAAVPIYRFAVYRVYSSEAKATVGTIMSSMRVFATENDGPYPDFVFGTSSDTDGADILQTLGVDTSTNTWWHAGYADTEPISSSFGTVKAEAAGGSKPTALDRISLEADAVGPFVWAHGDVANQPITGIQLLYDMGKDKWYIAF